MNRPSRGKQNRGSRGRGVRTSILVSKIEGSPVIGLAANDAHDEMLKLRLTAHEDVERRR